MKQIESAEIKLELDGILFTWDDEKEKINIRKHGLDFTSGLSSKLCMRLFSMPLSENRSGQFKVSEVALESFPAVSVPSVASSTSFVCVIEVKIHLSVKDTF